MTPQNRRLWRYNAESQTIEPLGRSRPHYLDAGTAAFTGEDFLIEAVSAADALAAAKQWLIEDVNVPDGMWLEERANHNLVLCVS